MNFFEFFNINLNSKEMVSVVGAGGKTSTILRLANEFKLLGKKVLIATSTAIFFPKNEEYDLLIIDKKSSVVDRFANIENGSITIVGRSVSKENKLLGIKKEYIEEIYDKGKFDIIFVEADGAKRKTIKCPAVHEPVIPNNTTVTIGVIGLDSIGLTINDDNIHRAKLFCNVTEKKIGEHICEKSIAKLILDKKGLFKGAPDSSLKYVLLNKNDSKRTYESAQNIAENVLQSSSEINDIIVGSVINNVFEGMR